METTKLEAGVIVIFLLLGLHPVLQYLINKILGVISALALVTHFCLLDLDYPLNVLTFLGQLFPIIAFDFLPEEWLVSIFQLADLEDDPISEQFESVGYENKSIVYVNLGSLLVFIVLMPITYYLFSLVLCLPHKKIKNSDLIKMSCLGRWISSQKRKFWFSIQTKRDSIVWNGFLRFYTQNYLILTVIGWIGVKDLRFGR